MALAGVIIIIMLPIQAIAATPWLWLACGMLGLRLLVRAWEGEPHRYGSFAA
jgi:hypothetical protein